MKSFLGIVAILPCISYLLLGCSKEGQNKKSQDDSPIAVVNLTGNEVKPEARMLAIKSEVESLDERGEYKIAYRLINDCLAHNYSLESMQYAIEHADNHLSRLLSHNTTTQKSVFITPKGKSTWDIIVDRYNITEGKIIAEYIPYIGRGILIGNILNTLKEEDKLNYQSAVVQEFVLVDKEQSNEIIAQYDTLHDSLQEYLDLLLKSYSVNDIEDVKQHYFTIRDRAESLKKKVKDSRCNYVSYQVISPALAEISKEHYIATFKWLGLDDKQIIKDAVIHLAHSFHNEWIFESTEEVRLQFIEVVKSLKNDVGKAEWEELKTVTTLVDSNDPSKPRGADAWWR